MPSRLHADHVSLSYPGMAQRALDDVALEVRPGECVALLGPNGAGKTTLIRLATGLLSPDAGTIRVGGGNPRRADTRTRLGVMLQDTAFPSHLTVRELVVGAARRAGCTAQDADRLLDELGLSEVVGRRSHALSGGQRRRVQLARALVVEPELLVLDEPTEGLDAESRHRTWEHLAARRDAGTAILLTTHLITEADSMADRVVVIADGRIVADAPPAVLKDHLPDRTVRMQTSVPVSRIRALPGVNEVIRRAADGPGPTPITIVTPHPEQLLRRLLDLDPGLRGLRVEGASLEDAIVAISRSGPASRVAPPDLERAPTGSGGAQLGDVEPAADHSPTTRTTRKELA